MTDQLNENYDQGCCLHNIIIYKIDKQNQSFEINISMLSGQNLTCV